jgi:hypothetical protein
MRSTKLAMATLVVSLSMVATAQAVPVIVGSPLTQTFSPSQFNVVATVANVALPEPGARIVSPVSGAVVAWHLTGAEGGPFKLRVLRPVPGAPGVYLGAGSGAPALPTNTGLQTFATAIPIQAGDLIGLDNANKTDRIGTISSLEGSGFIGWIPPLPDGATAPGSTTPNREIAFNAEVKPAPTLVSISPTSGSIKGGTTVTVAGTDLSGATGVSFGGVPASSFVVNSEGQLTAVAPPTNKPGAIDVTVTTVAGTTPPSVADHFTYKACVVPNLKGKTLKAAKKRVRKAGCKVGKVKRRADVSAKTGKVVKQGPKPRKVLAPGAKVNFTLS